MDREIEAAKAIHQRCFSLSMTQIWENCNQHLLEKNKRFEYRNLPFIGYQRSKISSSSSRRGTVRARRLLGAPSSRISIQIVKRDAFFDAIVESRWFPLALSSKYVLIIAFKNTILSRSQFLVAEAERNETVRLANYDLCHLSFSRLVFRVPCISSSFRSATPMRARTSRKVLITSTEKNRVYSSRSFHGKIVILLTSFLEWLENRNSTCETLILEQI